MDQPPLGSLGRDSPPDAPQSLLIPSRSVRSLQGPISRADRGPTLHTSRTWTTSSGDHGIMSDTDEWEDRASFVQEYNRLATKHGVRILVIEDFDFRNSTNQPTSPRKPSWLRRILRSVSSQPTSIKAPAHQLPRHKRSVSDFAHSLLHRNESPKRLDLQTMVRICGKSTLYLPAEYAPSALILPTSIRATAHYLSQNVPTRGIFRIPGSIRVVNTLYDYYCCIEHGNVGITGTVRCPTLPTHVHASVNDVASTFKRLLSVIPGGILGSLSLFDAFVAVNSQLQGDPELTRTKQSRVRARLIALAVATVESQFRRELICAVFGLLSLIGRHAETTPREDESGRPLPTTDLMGYNALGIVFGPLLLGDMLEHYTMKVATPKSGLLVLPLRSPKLHKDRRRGRTSETKDSRPPTVDKIHIANTIAEMLISNWRDVVRQMKSLDVHRQEELPNPSRQHEPLPSSQSNFVLTKPQGWDQTWSSGHEEIPREGSPGLATPTPGVSRQRSRSHSSPRSTRLVTRSSVGILSPTVEETSPDDGSSRDAKSLTRHLVPGKEKDGTPCRRPGHVNTSSRPESMPPLVQRAGSTRSRETGETLADVLSGKLEEPTLLGFSRRSSLPSRLQSKQRPDTTNTSKSKPPKASKDVPIERKNAIRRKKNPAKDKHRKKSGHQAIAVEWPETTTESSTGTDFRDSQSIHLEFSSEQEALEAAIKAHAEEMKQLEALDAAEQQRNSVASRHTERQGLPDIKMGEPIQNGENTYFASNVVTQRDSKAPADHASLVPTPREFYSPMQTPLTLTEENVSCHGVSSPEVLRAA
ncbi:Rho-GAP domain-containing protein [Fusarium keratoplasticum]|nr:Rho-GAP domain-containing protein [Fusarium keratoplasticum]